MYRGRGPAGLTIAMELARQGIAVSVFESGPLKLHKATSELNVGTSVGAPYEFSHGHRSRCLGGGSNCWGGFCGSWDPWDFEKRDWIPDSGWPVSLDTLHPYYRRALPLLKVRSDNYDPAFWEKESLGTLKRVPVDPARIREVMTHFSPPLEFGREFGELFRTSELIKIYLWNNAVHIDTESSTLKVNRVEFKTLQGNRFFAKAKHFVLAAGGIENSRILLNSNRVHASGLGNSRDVVGRYFMDHPRMIACHLTMKPAFKELPFYDLKFYRISDSVKVKGIDISAQFMLPYETQKREGLLNSQLWLRSLYFAETSNEVESLKRMKMRLIGRHSKRHMLRHDVSQMLRRPLAIGRFTLAHLTGSRAMVHRVAIEAIVEPEPIAESRVALSDQVDSLGMRRARVDWRLTDRAKRTFDRSSQLLGQELMDAGVAQVEFDEPLEGRAWPKELSGT